MIASSSSVVHGCARPHAAIDAATSARPSPSRTMPEPYSSDGRGGVAASAWDGPEDVG